MNEENLYDKLRKRRQNLGYSQDYVADLLGMSQPYYSFIENGINKLTPALIQKIKEIKCFADFDEEPPILAENLAGSEPVMEVVVIKPAVEQKEVSLAEKLEIAEPADSQPPRKGIPSFWPWSETSLYVIGSVVALLLLNMASRMADDIVRGFGNQVPQHGAVTVIIMVLVFLFYVFLWYLFVRLVIWLVKWMRRRKNKNYKYL